MKRYIVLLPLAILVPQMALAQALPWKTQQAGQAQPSSQPAQKYRTRQAAPVTPPPAAGESTRDEDDRRLADLAGQFYQLHEHDSDAIAKIKKLENEVKHFEATLKGKSYDADILKDTRSLARRITHQRKEWEARQKAS